MPQPKITVNGDKLLIEVDLSANARKEATPSKTSGKTLVLAGTNGFAPVHHPKIADLKVMLNVTVPNPEYVKE